MKKILFSIFILVLAAGNATKSHAQLMGKFIIGGSDTADFATPADAAAAMTAEGMLGGIFEIESGTYAGGLNLSAIPDTVGVTITFRAVRCGNVTITDDDDATLTISGISKFSFYGIRFENTGNGNALATDGTTNEITLERCDFVVPPVGTPSISKDLAVLRSEGSGELALSACNLNGGTYGIYSVGPTQQSRKLSVVGCSIEGFYYKGIYAKRAARLTIEGNTIINAPQTNALFMGINVRDIVSSRIRVNENRVLLSSSTTARAEGVALYNNSTLADIHTNVISIQELGSGAATHKGLVIEECLFMSDVLHNTVVVEGRHNHSRCVVIENARVKFQNNLVSYPKDFSFGAIAEVENSNPFFYQGENNIWFAPEGHWHFGADGEFYHSIDSLPAWFGEPGSTDENPSLDASLQPATASPVPGIGFWMDINDNYRPDPTVPGAVRAEPTCALVPETAPLNGNAPILPTPGVSLILGKKSLFGSSVAVYQSDHGEYRAIGAPGAGWKTQFSPTNPIYRTNKLQGGTRVFLPNGEIRDFSSVFGHPITGTPSSKHAKKSRNGESVALGQLTSCGEIVLVYGAPGADYNSRNSASTGNDDGAIVLRFLESGKSIVIAQDQGGFAGQLGKRYNFGTSVAFIGDVNGDGVNDLAVGAIGSDLENRDGGSLWILFMKLDGTVSDEIEIAVPGLGRADNFAYAVAGLGDHDGDGTPDIAVGATKDDDEGKDNGAVYILFLNPDGSIKGHAKRTLPVGAKGNLGSALAVGDFDNDGLGDLVVGASGYAGSAGLLCRVFLNSDGSTKHADEFTQTMTVNRRDKCGEGCAVLGTTVFAGVPGSDLVTHDGGVVFEEQLEVIDVDCAQGIASPLPQKQEEIIWEEEAGHTNIEFLKQENTGGVYPNPAAEGSNIRFRDAPKNGTLISVFNINGSLVSSQKIEDGILDVSTLTPGFYTLNYMSGDEVKSTKLVIQ